ncbi:heme exporter protein CcmD [Planctobacterium marinum]|uniref:heme exporter protein CcmD n=1 Tax=Planctobacterium marinum TaxID=1631968 RepID=UPI001E4094F9|nr:heme exporter protein CcmD [Planctobacterium marinum]MCC2606172.1 heme exporter protein CcmD [Planctobacterium marinum]
MQFASIGEFFAMGGYGFYVWMAFGISFFLLIVMWFAGHWQSKLLFSKAQQELARAQRIKTARAAKKSSQPDNS